MELMFSTMAELILQTFQFFYRCIGRPLQSIHPQAQSMGKSV